MQVVHVMLQAEAYGERKALQVMLLPLSATSESPQAFDGSLELTTSISTLTFVFIACG